MTLLFAEIWACLSVTALTGVLAGWLVCARRNKRIVATYRGRLARLRANWETVEERLAETLNRASTLERERDLKQAEFERYQDDLECMLREEEKAWRDEIRFLEDKLREVNERTVATGPSLPAQPSAIDVVPNSQPGKALSRSG